MLPVYLLRSCVKFEVAVMGSLFLIIPYGLCGRIATLNLNFRCIASFIKEPSLLSSSENSKVLVQMFIIVYYFPRAPSSTQNDQLLKTTGVVDPTIPPPPPPQYYIYFWECSKFSSKAHSINTKTTEMKIICIFFCDLHQNWELQVIYLWGQRHSGDVTLWWLVMSRFGDWCCHTLMMSKPKDPTNLRKLRLEP